MTNLLKFLGLTLMAIFLFASCSKDDNTILEVKEEPIETYAEFNINNRSFTTDAVAWYCNDNEKEFLSVSTKVSLLGLEINAFEMEDTDFTFISATDAAGSYTVGGAVFGTAVTGSSLQQNLFDAAATVDVTSNDGAVVSGSMSGIFLVTNDNGEMSELPYTVTFTADIIDSSTFCD